MGEGWEWFLYGRLGDGVCRLGDGVSADSEEAKAIDCDVVCGGRRAAGEGGGEGEEGEEEEERGEGERERRGGRVATAIMSSVSSGAAGKANSESFRHEPRLGVGPKRREESKGNEKGRPEGAIPIERSEVGEHGHFPLYL